MESTFDGAVVLLFEPAPAPSAGDGARDGAEWAQLCTHYDEVDVIAEKARVLASIDRSEQTDLAGALCHALLEPDFWRSIRGGATPNPPNAYTLAFLEAACEVFGQRKSA